MCPALGYMRWSMLTLFDRGRGGRRPPAGAVPFDMQRQCAVGREVTSNPAWETVHVCWIEWDFISGDVDRSDLAHVTLHQRSELDFPCTVWHRDFLLAGSGLHPDTELPRTGINEDEFEIAYPDVTVEQNAGSEKNSADVMYGIATGAEDGGRAHEEPSNRLRYWHLGGGALAPIWMAPVLIDPTRILRYTIDADDNSGDMSLVYHPDWMTDGIGGLNNVLNPELQTSGAGWLSEFGPGPGHKTFVTSHEDPDGPQAWTETSVVYDHTGDLHILYTGQRVAGEGEHIALEHWSWSRGNSRIIQSVYYENPGFRGRMMSIGHVSLASVMVTHSVKLVPRVTRTISTRSTPRSVGRRPMQGLRGKSAAMDDHSCR